MGFSGAVGHQLSATRLLSSPEGSRHRLDGLDHTWTFGDSYSSLHRDNYMEVRPVRNSVFTWGCFRACRARIHQSLAKRKVKISIESVFFFNFITFKISFYFFDNYFEKMVFLKVSALLPHSCVLITL